MKATPYRGAITVLKVTPAIPDAVLSEPGGAMGNQIYIVTFTNTKLTQASFLQKNQTLQNVFLIVVMMRWHRASVACKNQSF